MPSLERAVADRGALMCGGKAGGRSTEGECFLESREERREDGIILLRDMVCVGVRAVRAEFAGRVYGNRALVARTDYRDIRQIDGMVWRW